MRTRQEIEAEVEALADGGSNDDEISGLQAIIGELLNERDAPPTTDEPAEKDCPHPGQTFDDGLVVASGWVADREDDTRIGLLTIVDAPPYYRVREYRWAGDGWEWLWGNSFENLIPAVADFDARFEFWGGGDLREAMTARQNLDNQYEERQET